MRKTLILLLLAGMAASISAQTVAPTDMERASDPNQVVGEALQTTGIVSLSVGVPCLAAGMACLMYANFVPNPMEGYTTIQAKADADSRLQYLTLDEYKAKADADSRLQYLTLDEYKAKAQAFTASTHAAEVAGYILMPMGGALTVVGIPLYLKGHKMVLDIQYTGNGAGVAINF